MTPLGTDIEALRLVAADDVETLLLKRGWSLAKRVDGRASFWKDPDGRPRVTVPLTREFSDYPERIADVLRTLQVSHDLSWSMILNDLEGVGNDTVRVHEIGRDSAQGTTTLASGRLLIDLAEKALRDAAHQAAKTYGGDKAPKPDWKEYLRSLRLGQTERGSFVVRVLSPLPDSRDKRQLELDTQAPFPRAVTERVVRNLSLLEERASEAAESPNHLRELFVRTAHEGITPGMCDVLAATTESNDHGPDIVEISFDWAARLPVPHRHRADQPVRFDRPLLQVIRKGAQIIRDESLAGRTHVGGWVIRLHQEVADFESGGRAAEGEFTLLTKWGANLRRFRVTLPGKKYLEAVDAHQRNAYVVCRGRVERAGNQFYLRDAVGFRVLASETEELAFGDSDEDE